MIGCENEMDKKLDETLAIFKDKKTHDNNTDLF
jgi:hypothetical protein